MNRYLITELGVPQGFAVSRAKALNDNGDIIGSLKKDAGDFFNSTACIWKGVDVRVIENNHLTLTAINNLGQAVGKITKQRTRRQFATLRAACYNDGQLETLLPRTQNNIVEDINDLGQIVGWISTLPDSKTLKTFKIGAFQWQNGKWEYLSTPSGYDQSQAYGINNLGQTVGDLTIFSPWHYVAVMWNEQEVIVIEPPMGFNHTRAVDINNCGQVLLRAIYSPDDVIKEMTEKIFSGMSAKEAVQGYQQTEANWRQQSILWKDGQYQPIDGLAESVNDFGQVVGWSGCSFIEGNMECASPYAFVWQNGTLIDLNTMIEDSSGWVLTRAYDITCQVSDDCER